MVRKFVVLALASLWLFASVPALAATSESFMITYRGNVSAQSLAQVMANRMNKEVVITRMQQRSLANPKTRVQKFRFLAIIGNDSADCTFVRTAKADGVACSSKTAKLGAMRINWSRDLSAR